MKLYTKQSSPKSTRCALETTSETKSYNDYKHDTAENISLYQNRQEGLTTTVVYQKQVGFFILQPT